MAYGTYGGGNASAASDPIGAPGIVAPAASPLAGGPPGDMYAFMKQALMEQYARKKWEQNMADKQAAEDRARAIEMQKHAESQAQIAHMQQQGAFNAARGGGGGQEGNGLDTQMRGLQAEAENDRLSALRNPAVKYQPGGAGYAGGYMMEDPAKMNAYQRQAYMPQSSQMGADRTAGPAIGGREFEDIDAMNEARRRGYGRGGA